MVPMSTTTTAIRIGPADHGRRMTLAEFCEAEEEEGYRYELARGVLEVTFVPDQPHGLIVWKLLCLISAFDMKNPGVVFRAGGAGEFRLWLPSMVSRRNPDVAVALKNTPKDPRGWRPPTLVMEVVSKGSEAHERDYATKREEYLAFGIREYWIVDPQTRLVTILVRDGDAWVEHVFREEQQATSFILSGLAIKVADLWAEVEDEDNESSDEEGQH
jgi:Uma2 family endonuclease